METCVHLSERVPFTSRATAQLSSLGQLSNPLFRVLPTNLKRTAQPQQRRKVCRAGITTVFVPQLKDEKRNARLWTSPGSGQESHQVVKQLLESDTGNALADHFESKRADKGLWCTIASSDKMKKVGIHGCKGLLLKRRKAGNVSVLFHMPF
jgi:hypothetical protein